MIIPKTRLFVHKVNNKLITLFLLFLQTYLYESDVVARVNRAAEVRDHADERIAHPGWSLLGVFRRPGGQEL